MLAAGDGEDGAEGAGREGAGEAERLPPGEGEAPPLAVPQSGCEAEGAQLAESDAPPLPLRAPLWLPLSLGALREGSAQGDTDGEPLQEREHAVGKVGAPSQRRRSSPRRGMPSAVAK